MAILEILGINALVGLGIASLIYTRNYFALSNDVLFTRTRQASPLVFEDSEFLAGQIVPRFDDFNRYVLEGGKHTGSLDARKIIINNVKRRSGLRPDRDIFIDEEDEKLKLSCGLLFASNVALGSYKKGIPLELTVQSMFTAMETALESTCLCAFDKDLHVIKTFDNSYNVTADGLFPKNIAADWIFPKRGHHSRLDFALEKMAEQFGETKHTKILYVVTGPIKGAGQREDVKEKVSDLRMKNINVGFIYINTSNRPIEPVGDHYVVLAYDEISQLPKYIGKLNDKILGDLE